MLFVIVPIFELAHLSLRQVLQSSGGLTVRIYAPGASRHDHAQSCITSPAALLLERAMEGK
jgi:hypothetical protein